jgi:hypothetical protein
MTVVADHWGTLRAGRGRACDGEEKLRGKWINTQGMLYR